MPTTDGKAVLKHISEVIKRQTLHFVRVLSRQEDFFRRKLVTVEVLGRASHDLDSVLNHVPVHFSEQAWQRQVVWWHSAV